MADSESNAQANKKSSPLFPFLKNIIYKKGRFLKYKLNYGANIFSQSRFYLYPPSKEEMNKEEEEMERKYAYKEETPKAKSKKRWLSFLYFAINIAVVAIVLGVQLSQESNPTESLLSIKNLNWWFILIAFGCFVGGMIFDQIRFSVLIHKATGRLRPHLSYKVAAVGRYYDNLTPLGTGGQPFQVVYMNKYGIKPGKGISIAMGKFIYHQIVYTLFATFFMFRQLFVGGVGWAGPVANGVALTLSWIGYFICIAVITMVLLISLNRRVGTGLVVGCFKLLSKIKIGRFRVVKDYQKSFKSVMSTAETWQKTTKEYNKSFFITFVCVVCSLAYFVLSFSMPYFIYCAFEGWNPSVWLNIISIAVMVDLASAFNPIPMGTGTADISFTAFFTSFFTSGAQFWALIIWRILFYYIYVLQGIGIVVYDYAIGNRRLEKNKEFWKLTLKERKKWRKEHKQVHQTSQEN